MSDEREKLGEGDRESLAPPQDVEGHKLSPPQATETEEEEGEDVEGHSFTPGQTSPGQTSPGQTMP